MNKRYEYPIPGELRKNVTAICGRRGIEWLHDLPRLVGELELEWNVVADVPFEKGEFNFVAPARGENGPDTVLKISPPYERIEIYAEAAFLRARQGVGCVHLLSEDRGRLAILVERARPGESMDERFALEPFACVEPAIEVLKIIQLTPQTSDNLHYQYLDDWVARFRRFRDTDFPQDYGEKTLAIYEKLVTQREKISHIHGDFHPGNIVTATRVPFLAIDAKGLIGHIAYDIAVFLNNLHWWQKGKTGVQRNLFAAAERFGNAFDIDPKTIREAAYAGMVIGAWWSFEDAPEFYDGQVVLADIWDV